MRHFLLILFLFQFLFSNTDECLIISDSENYNSYNYFQSISIDNLDNYQDQSYVFETNIDENVFGKIKSINRFNLIVIIFYKNFFFFFNHFF